MKILRLRAFGAFTNVALGLAEGREGLHLIYGPNEAGKSTALRALRQMLYKIPAQTPDNFLHRYDDLRVGATLRHADGSELAFLRRKGNKKTLRSSDDQSDLDDGALDRFLGDVDEAQFQTLFGIGHAELAAEGRAIVEGGGRVGELLFGAGLDLARLRLFQRTLEVEMGKLFKPTGTVPVLNKAIAEVAEAREAIRIASLRGTDYLGHVASLAEARKCKEERDRSLIEAQRRKARLERIEQALPDIAARRRWLDEREPLADATILRDDFSDERGAVQADLKAATLAEGNALEAIEDVRRKLAGIVVPAALLERADAIEALQRRLGGHQKAMEDAARLNVEQKSYLADARTKLRDLGYEEEPERVERLRLRDSERSKIYSQGNERLALAIECEGAFKEIDAIGRRIEEARAKLDELETGRDVEDLRKALKRALRQGELEEVLDAARKGLKKLEKQAEAERRKLPLWSGDLDELDALPVPSAETLERFQAELADAEGRVKALLGTIGEKEDEVRSLDRKIEQQRLEQDVPGEDDLEAARARREEGWQLVRRAWNDGRTDEAAAAAFLSASAGAAGLADAFEHSVQKADELADRLRREAKLVATKAKWVADRNDAAGRLATLAVELTGAQACHADVGARWSTLWRPLGIEPLTPREMLAWLRDQQQLAARVVALRDQRELVLAAQEKVDAVRRDLCECLRDLGEPASPKAESLADRIERCQDVIEQVDDLTARRQTLERELTRLERDMEDARRREVLARNDFRQWQTFWARLMTRLKLAEDATTAEANDYIARLDRYFEARDKLLGHQDRIRTIEADRDRFFGDVTRLADLVAPELAEEPAELVAAELNVRLGRARTARTQWEQLAAQLCKHELDARSARITIDANRDRLAALCREAGCRDESELEAVEQRSACRRKLDERLGEAEGRLRTLSGGVPLEGFLAEAEAVDADALAPEIRQLQETIEELDRQRQELSQAVGREDGALRLMEEHARQAKAQEALGQQQSLLVKVASGAEQYARLKLAAAVLRDTIERYREKNQGPILQRAGALFAELTIGSFEGLRTDTNDKDEPVLVGVRPGGQARVGVDGMSDGTADQLYLALKLATLEHYLDSNPAMPFVVDDLLIHFDNPRAVAALRALARLSGRTQVLFFTHHEHLVDLARATIDGDVLFTHRLPGR